MGKTNIKLKSILIHGWGGSAESLTRLAEELQTILLEKEINLESEYLELPGNGSTPLQKVLTIEDYENFVLHEFSDINSKSDGSLRVLIGHSFGGHLLLRLCSQKKLPENTLIILIAASGVKPKPSFRKTVSKAIALVASPVKNLASSLGLDSIVTRARRVFYKFIVRSRDYEKVVQDPVKRDTFINIINSHVNSSDLTKIQNKTLIVWGENDLVTPVWMAKYLAEHIPHNDLVIVPGARHGIPNQESKDCAMIIVDFLLNRL